MSSMDKTTANKTISHQTISREEEADLTLRRTKVSRRLAAFITLIFLALIFAPPIAQHYFAPPMSHGGKDFWSLFPTWNEVRETREMRDASLLLPTHDETKEFEVKLESEALLSKKLLSPTQNVMSKTFHAGNEQVYMGRDKWLFAKAEIDYLTGKGFLDPKVLHRAELKGENANPVPAIIDFHRQLKARGITLIVMPVPAKGTVHPEQFSGLWGSRRSTPLVPENASFSQLEDELKREKILVYDPRELLLKAKETTKEAQYFPGDTHWTPQAMTRVARDLAHFIRQNIELPTTEKVQYKFSPSPEVNITDLEIMLKLPKKQKVFEHQKAQTQRVLDPDGALWKPQTDADILLLGDSFSNIYSRPGFWGHAAGLGEHLSYYLKRPLDRIAINGGGASAIRARWQSDLQSGKRDLKTTRVVIYEFATRALANNNWKIIDISPTLQPPSAETFALEKFGPEARRFTP